MKKFEIYDLNENLLKSFDFGNLGKDDYSITIGVGTGVMVSLDPSMPTRLYAALVKEGDFWNIVSSDPGEKIKVGRDECLSAPAETGLNYLLGHWIIRFFDEANENYSGYCLVYKSDDGTNCTMLNTGTNNVAKSADGKIVVNPHIVQNLLLKIQLTVGSNKFKLIKNKYDDEKSNVVHIIEVGLFEQFSIGNFSGVIMDENSSNSAMKIKNPLSWPSLKIKKVLKFATVVLAAAFLGVCCLYKYSAFLEKYLSDQQNVIHELDHSDLINYLHDEFSLASADNSGKYGLLKEQELKTIAIPKLIAELDTLRSKYFYQLAMQILKKYQNTGREMPPELTELRNTLMFEESLLTEFLNLRMQYYYSCYNQFKLSSQASDPLNTEINAALLAEAKQLYETYLDKKLYLDKKIPEKRKFSSSYLRFLNLRLQLLEKTIKYHEACGKIKRLALAHNWNELLDYVKKTDKDIFVFFGTEQFYDDALEVAIWHADTKPRLYKNFNFNAIETSNCNYIANMRTQLKNGVNMLQDNMFFPHKTAIKKYEKDIQRINSFENFISKLNNIQRNGMGETAVNEALAAFAGILRIADFDEIDKMVLVSCRKNFMDLLIGEYNKISKLPEKNSAYADRLLLLSKTMRRIDPANKHLALSEKIQNEAEEVKANLEKQFSVLYTEYKFALMDDNRQLAEKLLNQMIALGPVENQFYHWALKEKKNMGEEKK